MDSGIAYDQSAGRKLSRHGLRFSARSSGPVRPPRYVVVGWFQLDPAIPENQSWSTIWVWDGFNWTQISPANSPRPRAQHALAYASANQQVVLFGGSGNLFQGHVAFSDTWTWDGSNWTEQFPTNSPPLRYAHAMVYDSAESRSVMFGGFDEQLNSYDDTWV